VKLLRSLYLLFTTQLVLPFRYAVYIFCLLHNLHSLFTFFILIKWITSKVELNKPHLVLSDFITKWKLLLLDPFLNALFNQIDNLYTILDSNKSVTNSIKGLKTSWEINDQINYSSFTRDICPDLIWMVIRKRVRNNSYPQWKIMYVCSK
jgi:hypothetical protein